MSWRRLPVPLDFLIRVREVCIKAQRAPCPSVKQMNRRVSGPKFNALPAAQGSVIGGILWAVCVSQGCKLSLRRRPRNLGLFVLSEVRRTTRFWVKQLIRRAGVPDSQELLSHRGK